ncbi:MAG TPA: hypothetical protein VHB20_06770 [Verrucomicrobiae bacterium]|jgi:hypothetical protein|nr:hypothetical protein [Verrucomicrobiae bacterium]
MKDQAMTARAKAQMADGEIVAMQFDIKYSEGIPYAVIYWGEDSGMLNGLVSPLDPVALKLSTEPEVTFEYSGPAIVLPKDLPYEPSRLGFRRIV